MAVQLVEALHHKVHPVHSADNSAILVVPNVKVRMEAQHSIPLLSLHDLLQESCTCTSHAALL